MRQLLAVVLICTASVPCASQAGAAGRDEVGPRLLASGEGYVIHMFRGVVEPAAVGSKSWHMHAVRSGVVMHHTDLATGESKWLIRTGTYSLPTRRVTYSISRVVGLFRTKTQLAVVRYDVSKVSSARRPPPEKGVYRVVVFDRKTGKQRLDQVLLLTTNRPREVPEETTGCGVIRRTKRGFSVFGHTFVVDRRGEIAPGK